ATDQDGKTVDLGEIFAEGYTLVFFYPKANTMGCTKQACSLRDAYEDLTDEGVTVIGVSTDTAKAQKSFATKQNLPYTLIADPEGKVVSAFGVPKTAGFAARQAFLIKDGEIVWLDYTASTGKQAADVLEAMKTLQTS
ncbi:MAG: peroxiredoxin, partial [Verrucomicrobiota bacterium]